MIHRSKWQMYANLMWTSSIFGRIVYIPSKLKRPHTVNRISNSHYWPNDYKTGICLEISTLYLFLNNFWHENGVNCKFLKVFHATLLKAVTILWNLLLLEHRTVDFFTNQWYCYLRSPLRWNSKVECIVLYCKIKSYRFVMSSKCKSMQSFWWKVQMKLPR